MDVSGQGEASFNEFSDHFKKYQPTMSVNMMAASWRDWVGMRISYEKYYEGVS